MKGKDVKTEVKNRYSQIVTQNMPSCCGPSISTESQSEKLGYSKDELGSVPDGADLGLGCGNPVALASLKEGDVVLDLGSGAGFDAFLSANAVGKSGKVIGVDMTPQMIARAKENAVRGGYDNVEFRLGEIEALPVDENSVDVIISNCVINLSPDKQQVFNEAYRVLRPGGRLMVSDIVITKPLPEEVQQSVAAWTGCIAGASLKEDYLGMIKNAGFENVEIQGATNAGSLFEGIEIGSDSGSCCAPADSSASNLDSDSGSCCAPADSSTRNLGQDAVESIKVSATK